MHGSTGLLGQWLDTVAQDCQKVFRGDNSGGQAGAAAAQLAELTSAPLDTELKQRLTGDPLSQATRLVRRNVMVSATVTVLISLGARPGAGTMVTFASQGWLPIAAGLVVTAFLLCEFCVYLQTDRRAYEDAEGDRRRLLEKKEAALVALSYAQVETSIGTTKRDRAMAIVKDVEIPALPSARPVFDFHIPLLWGAFALGCSANALWRVLTTHFFA